MTLEEEILQRADLLKTNILTLQYNIRIVINDEKLIKEIDKISRRKNAAIERERKIKETNKKVNDYINNNIGEWKKLDDFVKGMPDFKYKKIIYLRLPVRLKKDKRIIGYLGIPWIGRMSGEVSFKFIGSGKQWDTRQGKDYEVFISDKAETKIIGMALDLAKK